MSEEAQKGPNASRLFFRCRIDIRTTRRVSTGYYHRIKSKVSPKTVEIRHTSKKVVFLVPNSENEEKKIVVFFLKKMKKIPQKFYKWGKRAVFQRKPQKLQENERNATPKGVDIGTTRRILIGYYQAYDQKSEEMVTKTGNGGFRDLLKFFRKIFFI